MKRHARIAALCLAVGGGAVALLLWAKLKLVAGIPRTVYAEPGEPERDPGPTLDYPDERDASESESDNAPRLDP